MFELAQPAENQFGRLHRGAGRPASLNSTNAAVPDELVVQRRADCTCGGGCAACEARSELSVSRPDDAAEVEADRTAQQVMQMQPGERAGGVFQRNAGDTVARKASAGQAGSMPGNNLFQSSGERLDDATRAFFEPRFGRDLGNVRIHTGTDAAQSAEHLGARAFTVGRDIGFAKGTFDPASDSGRLLLAHELAHTEQAPGVIRRQPAPVTTTEEVSVKSAPPEGVQLRMTPKIVNKPAPNTAPGDALKNGDKVVVKKFVNGGTWAWIEVPGKTSPDPKYPVMHGYIQTKFLDVVISASETKITKNSPGAGAQTGAVIKDAKVDSLLGNIDDVPSSAPPLDTYEDYKANKDTSFSDDKYRDKFIKGGAAKPYPGFSIKWNYDDNTMQIDADFQLTGTGSSDQNAKSIEASIKKFWNVKFGNFKLTTNVSVSFDATGTVSPDKAIIELFADPSKSSRLVKIGSGKPGNRKITLNTTTWDINWTPAHEFGHFIGLDDKYTSNPSGGTVAIPGWEKNMMADNSGTLSMWNIIELSLWWANWAN